MDPILIVPFFARYCCCLPKSLKEKLHCGYIYTAENIHQESIPDKEDNQMEPIIEEAYPLKTNINEASGKIEVNQDIC